MSSPVVGTDFEVTSFSGDVCERLKKLLELHSTLKRFFDWMIEPDGTFTDAFLAMFASIAVPTGGIIWYPTASVPAGYLIANGQAVSRTTYAALFSLYGTTFGTGDGSSTFNLPDLQGRFLYGADDDYPLGEEAGEKTHALTSAENGPHTHTLKLQQDLTSGSGNNFAAWEQSTTANTASTTTTESSGSGTAHNNMPPFRSGRFLVKY